MMNASVRSLEFGRAWRLAIGLVSLFAVGTISAQKSTFERTKPHLNIGTAGRVPQQDASPAFDFKAHVQVLGNGEAVGSIQLGFGDGSVLVYDAVSGLVELDERHSATTVVVFRQKSRERSFARRDGVEMPGTLLAVVQPGADQSHDVRWEIIGTGLPSGPLCDERIAFELPGRFQRVPGLGRRTVERFDPLVWLNYPFQEVRPEGIEATLLFEASAQLDRRSRGFGFVDLSSGDNTSSVRFDVLLGGPVRDPDGVVVLVLVLALQDRPLDMDNLVLATVRPNTVAGGEDCDIYDLIGPGVTGVSGLCPLRFDAIGEVDFAHPR